MKTPSSPKKSSHFGAGLLAGAIMGAAAGLFLKSSKG
jgi:gas vesicle protein